MLIWQCQNVLSQPNQSCLKFYLQKKKKEGRKGDRKRKEKRPQNIH